VALYIEPIKNHLLHLIDDEELMVENFMELYLSVSSVDTAAASLLLTGEQSTPLTNNLSNRSQQQNAQPLDQPNLLSLSLVMQHQPTQEVNIQEQAIDVQAYNKQIWLNLFLLCDLLFSQSILNRILQLQKSMTDT
jgi:hypothetical protein